MGVSPVDPAGEIQMAKESNPGLLPLAVLLKFPMGPSVKAGAAELGRRTWTPWAPASPEV